MSVRRSGTETGAGGRIAFGHNQIEQYQAHDLWLPVLRQCYVCIVFAYQIPF